MQTRPIIIAGGASFILAALAFTFVFTYLATNFNYPDILEGSAADVLPRLLAGGTTMRAVWAIYAFIPLLLVPGAVGMFFVLPGSRGRMTLALVLASISAFSMCPGLMRWPSIHWALAAAYLDGTTDVKTTIAAFFDGLNLYLGNYIGEFLGEITLAAFFLLVGSAFLKEARYPKWLGWSGVIFSLLFFVGAFRNVQGSVQIIADINNALLPVWMIVLGASVIWYARGDAL